MKAKRDETNTDLQRGFEPLRTIFAVLILLLGFAAAARAETGFGTIKATARDGQPFELVALASEIHYQIGGLVAEAGIRQRFSNSSSEWVEVQYLLPLPEGAAVHDMTLRVGERVIVGEIREKEQARSEYVEAAASGKRAALVESDRANLFRTAVSNIAPGETIEIEVRWWQQIAYRDDRFALTLPLTYTPRHVAKAGAGADKQAAAANSVSPATTHDDLHSAVAPRVAVSIDLDPGLPLRRVESPSHALKVTRSGTRYAIALADGSVSADRDFVLEWAPVLGAAPASAVLTETVDGETYAMVMMLPDSQLANPLPRELILVIDTSGSMEGESIKQARAALDLALVSLRPGDRFNVIQFNSVTEALFPDAVAMTPADVALAREWVAGLRANGGTEMLDALRTALRGTPPAGHVRQVVFATDGAVDDAAGLYELIDRDLGQSRLFPIGIGSAPNAQFIERAATSGRGSSVVIRGAGEVGERMRELFAKLDRPALRDLALSWPGVADSYPQRLPDLYAGEPLVVVARLSNLHGTLEARAANKATTWSKSLPLDHAASMPGIARLWAQRKIESLEQSIDRGANPEDVRDQVLRLAIEHHLISAYTSLIAVEQAPARDSAEDLASRRIANGLPAGSLAYAATATSAPLLELVGLILLLMAALLAWAARRRATPFLPV
ncbi:MAG: marine proteobacterial sortase target protein [Dokdonella sp.]|uniref:marine proteobacterial sortase target protein n=2 Tax=Dokdonella sp. TaxID=2291710 RepID=UPI002C78AFCE|nr:marine proteobacterial sortase target protein [Xanthomonadales bacterium]MBK7210140.1 marine proteobacterial sortase target protein [Xanthomonadales bacterium]HQW76303.1 marine proteobacterial sortase target protein [Dokdonella sp.]HQX65628.1 marine proteobacterial sortase target protein [Dokdonella sp.]HQY54903.1 marine proteobacterial sortase target protein [Dokdonella sp.]